ncbi:hypothetical protein [Mycolicibacter kumamotonensis]|uniref:Minor tail protein n=1 Tax=Mycolicibacter kumamotonensis TaxID=354243 RepID=A0A1B8SLE6_9MYCO|nr:hypothetical protein [Mycolicibacter kumamotonensis]OBY33513.1 hypothetical protein ACT18_00810 [Mycolicibacter kumamotonensis]
MTQPAATDPSALDGLYWNFTWPLGLKKLVDGALKQQQTSPNTPSIGAPSVREWFSQPRASTDDTTEVIQINFKSPSAISAFSMEIKRVSVRVEVWYQDRLNNWAQVFDNNRIPLSLILTPTGVPDSWYKWQGDIYPIVAKALQIRATRMPSSVLGDTSYVIGIRNALLRRNIYDRNAGRLPISSEQDAIGNVISKYIKDWDAPRAIDNNYTSYWKSAPQPDPNAVVNLFLDLRGDDNSPQYVDALDMQPLYNNQILNIYYSIDDTVGTRQLNPVTLPPDTDENTSWKVDTGRWDTSLAPTGTSSYLFPMSIGPLVNQDMWIGIEWIPDFDPVNDHLANNPNLFTVTPSNNSGTQWWPTIYYDVVAGAIALAFTDGTDTKTYSATLSPALVPGHPLRIAVGWTYESQSVYIKVCLQNGTVIAHLLDENPDLPAQVTVDGEDGFTNFRGRFTSHIVKLEDYTGHASAFLANPNVYVSPDKLLAHENGKLPSTTLDNAVYAANWTLQTHGSGGTDESFFSNKTWTPVWKNFLTGPGKLYFPQKISAKYLKLEFTNLTQEPYPVYDSGIKTVYQTFPISVQQTATTQHPGLLNGGLMELGTELFQGANGIGSVNWLNPASVSAAVDRIYGTTVSPVTVITGASTISSELPSTATSSTVVTNTPRTESANPYVYKRATPNSQVLAGNAITTLINDTIENITTISNGIAEAINDAFTPLVSWARNPTGAAPVQGSDWWKFPGGTFAMPAAVMNGLTALTDTVFGRAPSTVTRTRFVTTSVHRYDIKTVTRDAALAYFAGVREVMALSTTYISGQDPASFDFNVYQIGSSHWSNSDGQAAQLDTGPVTTTGRTYSIINPGFDHNLDNWTLNPADKWSRDGSVGRWKLGALTAVADGTSMDALSSYIDVTPGDEIRFGCWVWWKDLVGTDGTPAFGIGGASYLDDTEVDSSIVFAGIDPANYAATTTSWVHLDYTWTVPTGVNKVHIRPFIDESMTAGQPWFDSVTVGPKVETQAVLANSFTTRSTFAKVNCTFNDSGLVRSDSMWAQADPLDTNIDPLQLAYYVTTTSDNVPTGMWGDTFATWSDSTTKWGADVSLVAMTIDPNMVYNGLRSVHFTRAAGAGEAGLIIAQWTNFIANAMVRPCVVFYKPTQSNNQITLRIKRISDGAYISQEIITKPASGYWYTHQGQFVVVPDSDDQEYFLEVTVSGDDADEIYINDCYCELALIRYAVQLGSQASLDVTALRYAHGSAQVTATTPTNEVAVTTSILSPKAYAYGMTLTPMYLR